MCRTAIEIMKCDCLLPNINITDSDNQCVKCFGAVFSTTMFHC